MLPPIRRFVPQSVTSFGKYLTALVRRLLHQHALTAAKDQDEFISRETIRGKYLGLHVLQPVGYLLQCLISRCMSVSIVDLLKIIDIQHHDRTGNPGIRSAVPDPS